MSGSLVQSPKKGIRLWPIWAAVGLPLLLITLEATPIAHDFVFVMLGVPALFLVWAGLAVWVAILGCRQLWERQWKRSVISVVLPVIVLCVAFHFSSFIRFCNNAGDTVHFYVMYRSYSEAARTTPAIGEPKLLTFNLGGMIWASRGFVYDESDEIMREPMMQTTGWKARAQNSELGCGYGAIPVPGPSPLVQHWYIASFPC